MDLLRGEALSAAPGAPTSGVGRATARRVLDEGGRVVADITRGEDVARIIEAAGERIDGLANIAGIMDGQKP